MKTRQGSRRQRGGFTLIEMIIASLLLVIGVAGALAAIGASTRAGAYASQIQTAALLAQRQLAEAASQPDSLSGGDQEGSFDDPYSNYHWKQSVEATDYQNLFKVTVTVTWGNSSSPSQREITTYLRSDQNTIIQQSQQNYQNYQNNQSSSAGAAGGAGGTPGGASGP
jgi:type II secretion system protein I